jgi:hypothetical protein
MDKDVKKQDAPQPQSWDNRNRNFQRTENEEDVHGELDARSDPSQEKDKNKDKPNKNNEKK